MQGLQKKYMAVGVTWIVINSAGSGKDGFFNNNDEAKKILNERNSTVSHYIRDMTGEIGHLYGASTTPHMFIINKGKLAYMGAIDSIASGDKEDIAKATNYVSQALEEILAGKDVSTPVTQQYGCSVKYGE